MLKGSVCNTKSPGKGRLGLGSITFRGCCSTGFVCTELSSCGMRTLHDFLAASAALNKRSWGIETTQFHPVLLCCQLAFSIPLSAQKPQHGCIARMLYNRSFHSCFGICNPGLTVPWSRESIYQRVWFWDPGLCSSWTEASRSMNVCIEGRGLNLGTIPAATLNLWMSTACALCQPWEQHPISVFSMFEAPKGKRQAQNQMFYKICP